MTFGQHPCKTEDTDYYASSLV